MRCDDDYSLGGGDLHGPYDPDCTSGSVTHDFMRFCLLAKRRGVVPPEWDWRCFLENAAKHVPFAFEKSDAQERWGSENVFSAMMGGRSLRYTASVVYGCGPEFGSEPSDDLEWRIQEQLQRLDEAWESDQDEDDEDSEDEEFPKVPTQSHNELVSEIGGMDAWKLFNSSIKGRGNVGRHFY